MTDDLDALVLGNLAALPFGHRYLTSSRTRRSGIRRGIAMPWPVPPLAR